jgi:hypothetical protein
MVQGMLDEFKEYWNSHRIRRQPKKKAPTGVSPNALTRIPHRYDPNAINCAVSVDKAWVDQECERLGGLAERDRLFEWYPASFDSLATDVWDRIGRPQRTLETGWAIFQQMSQHLQAYYGTTLAGIMEIEMEEMDHTDF